MLLFEGFGKGVVKCGKRCDSFVGFKQCQKIITDFVSVFFFAINIRQLKGVVPDGIGNQTNLFLLVEKSQPSCFESLGLI
jgi:hypothetical protein